MRFTDFVTSQTRPHSAIRLGRHKLIHFYESGHDELYDLVVDVSEQRDLAAAEPARARELREQLDTHLKRVNARLPETESGVNNVERSLISDKIFNHG
jgi:hypothetical protein